MKPILKLINTVDEFQALQNDWNALYEKCERSTIFSSWDWMFTWWEVFQNEFSRKLFILCLYKEDELVGIAPFQIYTRFPKSYIQGRTLQFIGTGNDKGEDISSQFLDLMVLPEQENNLVDAVSKYLTQQRKKWDFADFEYLLDDAVLLRCFKDKSSKITRKDMEDGVRFTIPKVDDFNQYQDLMAKRWRKMFDKKNRTLERDGDIKIVSTEDAMNPEKTEKALKLLAEMHCSRWKEKLGRCVFEAPHFYEFHLKILQRFSQKNKAVIKTLYKDDEALASYYYFADKGQLHYYQSGFYSQFANRYSPLFILVNREIAMSIENQQLFDFMYADSSISYKKEQYAAEYKTMHRVYWSTNSFRFFIFDCAKYMQESLIAFKDKLTNKNK